MHKCRESAGCKFFKPAKEKKPVLVVNHESGKYYEAIVREVAGQLREYFGRYIVFGHYRVPRRGLQEAVADLLCKVQFSEAREKALEEKLGNSKRAEYAERAWEYFEDIVHDVAKMLDQFSDHLVAYGNHRNPNRNVQEGVKNLIKRVDGLRASLNKSRKREKAMASRNANQRETLAAREEKLNELKSKLAKAEKRNDLLSVSVYSVHPSAGEVALLNKELEKKLAEAEAENKRLNGVLAKATVEAFRKNEAERRLAKSEDRVRFLEAENKRLSDVLVKNTDETVRRHKVERKLAKAEDKVRRLEEKLDSEQLVTWYWVRTAHDAAALVAKYDPFCDKHVDCGTSLRPSTELRDRLEKAFKHFTQHKKMK